MELLQLKYFKDAAILENFSKVAELYMVPPSSVSHTISRLEDELSVKLFTRSGNKVLLNEAGKVFFNEVSASLTKLEKGKELIKKKRLASVRISLMEGATPAIPVVAEFKRQNPDIDFTFSKLSDRAKGNVFFDILVSTKPFEKDENHHSAVLFKERILVAISADNPLSCKNELCIDDIRGIPVIGLHDGSKLYGLMQSYFGANEYSPNIIVESENRATVAEFVKGGFGIAFYPEISWSPVQQEGIVSLPLSDFNIRRSIYISWPKEYEPSEATKRFIDFAIKWFKK